MITRYRHRFLSLVFTPLVIATIGMPLGVIARPRPPLPPLPEFAPLLSRADFDEPFWARTDKPESFHPAYADLVESWSGYALRRAGDSVTPFFVPALDGGGRTNVACASGAVRFWFRPHWSSGAGPGDNGRLADLSVVGNSLTVNWSLNVSPDGTALFLTGRGSQGAVDLLGAQIAWQAGAWHLLALNYGPKESALFIDGERVATGVGVPSAASADSALSIGSSATGSKPAGGEFDEVCAFSRPLSESAVASCYQMYAPTAALGPISAEEDAARREAAAKRRAEREAAGEGGAQMLRLLGGAGECVTNLPLYITNIFSTNITGQGWTARFEVQGTNAFGPLCDIFTTTNLSGDSITNSPWTWLERGPSCSTYEYTNQPDAFASYVLGTLRDSDNDGLTDAYEQLASKTATNVANSARVIYEGVISNQFPNNWFKLNDGSLTNAISGQPALTNTNPTWDVDAFATGSNAIQFNGTSQRMTAGGVISGGTGTNQGSMSLLFRSLTGYPTTLLSTQRYVFSQRGNATNEFGLFFETNNAPVDPGSLKVRIGSQTNTILASNSIVFGTWYYLAMTWNESNQLATSYIAPIGGSLISSNFNFGASNAFGNSSNVVFGNRQGVLGNNNSSNYPNAFRTPGNGALDQIAFWNRQLSASEVNDQFNTLSALFQGPAKAFDLSRWNILLPINSDGQLTGTDPLEISTGWLNSGFNYNDPADRTQKYFYLSNGNQMVFEVPWNGAKTGTSSGPRSELRGTNPDGSKDNWLPFGTNTLEATCVVESAGTNNDRKVIIGQLHSETASNPPVVISYNFPSPNQVGKVTATFKSSPSSSTDNNLLLATNVGTNTQFHYQVQLTGDGTNLSLHVEVSVNGVVQTATNQQTAFLATSPSDAWHTTTFYFKAGCYYPATGPGSPIAGNAKVTFTSLKATRQP